MSNNGGSGVAGAVGTVLVGGAAVGFASAAASVIVVGLLGGIALLAVVAALCVVTIKAMARSLHEGMDGDWTGAKIVIGAPLTAFVGVAAGFAASAPNNLAEVAFTATSDHPFFLFVLLLRFVFVLFLYSGWIVALFFTWIANTEGRTGQGMNPFAYAAIPWTLWGFAVGTWTPGLIELYRNLQS